MNTITYKAFRFFGPASLIIFVFSCSSVPDVKTLDIGQVKDDFNASAYYQKKLDRTNKTIATDPAQVDKKELSKQLEENMFAKDTLCYYTSEFEKEQYIGSKSDFINKKKDDEGVFGYTYNTVSWDKNDSLAVLSGVYFQKINMLENKDGQLLSLNATNESYTNGNHAKLVEQLNKQYGVAKTLLQDKAKNLEILEWNTAEDKIQLRTKIDTVETVLSISIDDKKEIKLETEYTIDYFKVNKKHLKDLQKLKNGKWYLTEED